MKNLYNGTREAFVQAMMELALEDERTIMVSADTIKALRATPYYEKYPHKIFDVGIAEQNAVGFAAGLASCGLVPFVGTYAGFITMRACEQVRTFVAYPNLNVKLVGLNGGIFGGEKEGVTHQFFEDIGIMRSIPGIAIVTPADANQVYKATIEIAKYDGPVYMRIGSGREHKVYEKNVSFNLGKNRVIVDNGNDAAIFASGFIINRVIKAANMLQEQGVHVTVMDVNTLKPLDRQSIGNLLKITGGAVTVEDHNIIGGLGSAIAEISAEHFPVPIKRIGLKDEYPKSGEAEKLLDYYGINENEIIKSVLSIIKKKNRNRGML